MSRKEPDPFPAPPPDDSRDLNEWAEENRELIDAEDKGGEDALKEPFVLSVKGQPYRFTPVILAGYTVGWIVESVRDASKRYEIANVAGMACSCDAFAYCKRDARDERGRRTCKHVQAVDRHILETMTRR